MDEQKKASRGRPRKYPVGQEPADGHTTPRKYVVLPEDEYLLFAEWKATVELRSMLPEITNAQAVGSAVRLAKQYVEFCEKEGMNIFNPRIDESKTFAAATTKSSSVGTLKSEKRSPRQNQNKGDRSDNPLTLIWTSNPDLLPHIEPVCGLLTVQYISNGGVLCIEPLWHCTLTHWSTPMEVPYE